MREPEADTGFVKGGVQAQLKSGKKFWPSFFSCQDGLSWHSWSLPCHADGSA